MTTRGARVKILTEAEEDEQAGLYGAWLKATKERPMTRKCLRCDRNFTAKGQVNRCCKSCKKIQETISSDVEVGLPTKRGMTKERS